ncbi:MAG TPA: type I 3-dehydroquinate dehydratase, partial [Lachnospiraceae bacterium]|nr:type I 3-dehydroquinate dehydratase [Lachnospiraceae bacterium]
LFTFRTAKEGGEKAIDEKNYVQLNQNVAKSGYVDLVDVELFMGEQVVQEILEVAHEHGVKVVTSNHDFEKTPEKEEILSRLKRMQQLGADLLKIAVMPNSKRDVLTLLMATEEMVTKYAKRPVITMSMAGTGGISRLCGEVFGSALTFGAVGKASAPGQIDVNDLHTVL